MPKITLTGEHACQMPTEYPTGPLTHGFEMNVEAALRQTGSQHTPAALRLADLCGELELKPGATCLADAALGIKHIDCVYAHVCASLARQGGTPRLSRALRP